MRKGLYLLIIFGLILSLSSCASAKKKPGKLDELDTRISNLETRLDKMESQRSIVIPLPGQKTESVSEVQKSKPIKENPLTLKEVQTALKKAGFYAGAIDGKKGPQTSKAVKDFQKANNLKADGIVGDKTNQLLRVHLKSTVK